MVFSRNVSSIDDYTLDDIYETIEQSKEMIDEVNTALIDIAAIRTDKEMQELKKNLEDAWYNAFKMLNKIKKEIKSVG